MMRLSLCIALLTISFCSSSCSQDGQSGVQKEAEARAKAWWDASVAKCGDAYYTRVKWSDLVMGQLVRKDELYQLKNASYYVKETPISEATKLNGVEWQGRIIFVATAYRKRSPDDSEWSAWLEGVPPSQSDFATMVEAHSLLDKGFNKVKGQWSIGEDGKDIDGKSTHTKPNCSEIPPG